MYNFAMSSVLLAGCNSSEIAEHWHCNADMNLQNVTEHSSSLSFSITRNYTTSLFGVPLGTFLTLPTRAL